MDLTRQEAQQALAEIEAVRRQARRAVAYGGAPYFLMLWGVVWFLGFLGSQFLPPETSGWTWLALAGAAVPATFVIGARLGRRVRSPIGARLGLFWLALLAYALLWLYLARPIDGALMSLLIVTFAMFGYVVMGLWLGGGIGWLGLAVTALALLGYFGLRPYYGLWMALVGGGALFGSGLYILRRWR